MSKYVKWLALALIAGLAIESWASGDSDASGGEEVFTYEIATRNQHWRNPDINLSKKWFDEHYGVKTIWIPTENEFEQLNVHLAAGTIPDLISLRMDISNLATYTDQGVLAALPLSRISEQMPEYKQYVEEFGDDKVWSYGVVDGEHMGLPIISPNGFYRQGVAWNAQWLINVGITEIPETIDEFEAAFLKFRNNDPDQDGKKNTYAFTAMGAHEDAPKVAGKGFFEDIFGAFGTLPWQWVEKDGRLVYGFTDSGAKEAMTVLADWYAAEVIDPEWVTDPIRAVGVNDPAWKFAHGLNGYIAIHGGDDYQWDGGGHINGKWMNAHPEHRKYHLYDVSCFPDDCTTEDRRTDVIAFTEIDVNKFAGEYHPYVTARPPLGPRGDRGMDAPGTAPRYEGFGKQLEDNAPKYNRLLEILNEISTDHRAYYRAALGCFVDAPPTEACADLPVFEWVPYNEGPLGEKFQTTAAWAEHPRKDEFGGDLAGGFSTNPFWVYHRWYMFAGGNLQRPTLLQQEMTNDLMFRPLKVALPSQAQYADIDKVLVEFFYEAILGEVSVNDWDSVVAEWRRIGGDQLEREANEWFDSIK